MAYALVGSAGAVSEGSLAAAITPAYGQSPTANNLLLLALTTIGSSTLPTTPSGWTIAKQVANSGLMSSTLYYKIAAGADGQPTVALVSGAKHYGQLYEFSGNATASPVDQTGSNTGAGTTIVVTAGGTDAQTGELMFAVNGDQLQSNATQSTSESWNNATPTTQNRNSTNDSDHYSFSYGFTTANGSADSNTYSQPGVIWGGACVLVSFLLPAAAVGATQTFKAIPFIPRAKGA